MLRALHTYRAARDNAERDGADVSADPVPPSPFTHCWHGPSTSPRNGRPDLWRAGGHKSKGD